MVGCGLVLGVGLVALWIRLALDATRRFEPDRSAMWQGLLRWGVAALGLLAGAGLWIRAGAPAGEILITNLLLTVALLGLGMNRLGGMEAARLRDL
jgi:hypothetical protein